MSKTRITTSLTTLATREEAEATMNELALAANNKRKLVARRDHEVLAINGRYETDIAACDAAVAAHTDALRVWAESHPEEFPKQRKSIEFLCGVLGFRTGMPKLSLLNRAWNWDKVVEAIAARGFQFIRNKPEVDKEAIIGFYTEATDKADVVKQVLTPIGVKVSQGESFFIEPKLTDLN